MKKLEKRFKRCYTEQLAKKAQKAAEIKKHENRLPDYEEFKNDQSLNRNFPVKTEDGSATTKKKMSKVER